MTDRPSWIPCREIRAIMPAISHVEKMLLLTVHTWRLCRCVYGLVLLGRLHRYVIGCEDRLRNDLYCVGWGVKLCSTSTSSLCGFIVGKCDYFDFTTVLSGFAQRGFSFGFHFSPHFVPNGLLLIRRFGVKMKDLTSLRGRFYLQSLQDAGRLYTGCSKKQNPGFNFAITSVNVYRF